RDPGAARRRARAPGRRARARSGPCEGDGVAAEESGGLAARRGDEPAQAGEPAHPPCGAGLSLARAAFALLAPQLGAPERIDDVEGRDHSVAVGPVANGHVRGASSPPTRSRMPGSGRNDTLSCKRGPGRPLRPIREVGRTPTQVARTEGASRAPWAAASPGAAI